MAKTPTKKPTTKKTAKKDLSVYILLDRSGSMQNLWKEALSSINVYVNKLDPTTKVTLASFDNHGYDILRDTTAKSWKDVDDGDATPRGMTPLYDSAGKLLNKMYDDNPKHGVFVVMTDGFENASREYTRDDILGKIDKAKKDKNWQIVFMGAEFKDVGKVSSSLGVASGQTVNSTRGNLGATMSTLAAYTQSYATTDCSINFTEEDKTKAETK